MFGIKAGDDADVVRKRHGRETWNHRSRRRTVVSNGEEIVGVVAFGVVVAETVERDEDYIRTRCRLGIGESGGDR
jgi:hypothetical protein